MKEHRSLNYKINNLTLLTLILGIVFIIVCFFILGIRANSVARDCLYFPSSGGEAPSLYGIYKIWSSEPLYHSLNGNASVFTYNYLFYYVYGLSAKLFSTKAENLAVFTNFFTLITGLCFLLVILSYLYRQTKNFVKERNDKLLRLIILSIPVIGYIGPFIGWWNLTARPDIMALGLEILALIFFLVWLRNEKSKLIIIVTLTFWLAWSLKQTAIFVWLGTLLVLGIQCRFKQVVISIVTFFLLSFIPLSLFGWPYIEHSIIVPMNIYSSLSRSIITAQEALIVGSHFYIPAVIFAIYFLISEEKQYLALSTLAVVFVITIIGGFLTASTIASSRNHFFSSFFVAQLFIVQYLILNWHSVKINKRLIFLGVILFSFSLGLLMSSLYLVFPNQLGKITLPVEPQPPYKLKEAEEVRQIIHSAAKPVFVEWAYYALPWNSGQNPSEVVEWDDYSSVYGKGLIVSLEKRVQDKYYAESFVIGEYWYRLFEDSGYKKVSIIGGMVHFVRP